MNGSNAAIFVLFLAAMILYFCLPPPPPPPAVIRTGSEFFWVFSAVHRDFILALSANEVHVSFQNGTYHCTVYGTGSLLCVIPQVSRTSLEQYRTVIGIGFQ